MKVSEPGASLWTCSATTARSRGIAHHAFHPGDDGQALSLGHLLDAVDIVRGIDRGIAGIELDALFARTGVDDQFAALIGCGIVEEDRDRAVDPERVGAAHDDVVHVIAVTHARLVAAQDGRKDAAWPHDDLELLVLPEASKDHAHDLVALVLAERQFLVDLAVGDEESGRLHAVGELAGLGCLAHGGDFLGRKQLANDLEHVGLPA
jgi:hypothetical protein